MDRSERRRLVEEALRLKRSGVSDAENAALALLKPVAERQFASWRNVRERAHASTANDR